MHELHDKRDKPEPLEANIRYCEMRLKVIEDLQDGLMPNDKATIEKILKNQLVFRC
ncbi:MAG: hypothetical protein IPO35_15080 [Uliginosibacterium sp.]|nr:hypothetical protein [Uliginosibacterium sp.]